MFARDISALDKATMIMMMVTFYQADR